MRPNPQETAEKDLYLMKPQGTADLVTFTEENLNGKLHFSFSMR